MKQLLLTLLACVTFIFLNAQNNFIWEKQDTINKTKSQLYSDTKLFISTYWKSAQNVIQNDDKDAGIIVVKGKSIQKINHSVCVYTYTYSYTATFKFKDGKYKFVLDNVYCEDAYPIGCQYNISKIEPFLDGEYNKVKTTFTTGSLPEKKAVSLMSSLKLELKLIYDNYIVNITEKNSDW